MTRVYWQLNEVLLVTILEEVAEVAAVEAAEVAEVVVAQWRQLKLQLRV